MQTVFQYHEETKHHQHRYARSLGYMDWATQPNPFREYQEAYKVKLPLALQHPTPPYSTLGTNDVPAAPFCLESISQLMQFSMGIAAYKTTGADSWAVRCNASSGNLHPTESYLILPSLLEEKTTITHYNPKNHELEILTEFESEIWQTLPEGSFFVALSSIAWREVWKYGERAFRYVQLDVGHAWQSIQVSALMLGWQVTKVDNISDAQIEHLLGLDQSKRFFETENGDMLLLVSPHTVGYEIDFSLLEENLSLNYQGVANQLSPTMHEWEIIPQIIQATATPPYPQQKVEKYIPKRTPTKESKEVVLGRRSVHVMDKERSYLTQEQFFTILKSVAGSLSGEVCTIELVLMVHRVKELDAGLYILVRNNQHKEALQKAMYDDFLWQETPMDNLYLLEKRDLTLTSKTISCSQDIASDGAFTLGMLTPFSQEIQKYTTHRYKELYRECGAIGQQLYLEATSLGLSGTGIGCFLDDMFHQLLGLKNNNFQSLYHFTVGVGYVDSRIMTKPAYQE